MVKPPCTTELCDGVDETVDEGAHSVFLMFDLPKGCYATTLIAFITGGGASEKNAQ